MSINPPKQIDYFAMRNSFIDAYADALHAIFVKDKIFHKAINDPQFGHYGMTDTMFDKVKRADVVKKWDLLFETRMGRRMNEGEVFAILCSGDPFWLVQTLWKRNLEIALGITRPVATATMMMMMTAMVTVTAICVPSNTWSRYKSDNDDSYDNDKNENDENDKKDDDNDDDDDDKKAVTCWGSYFGGEHPWKKSFDESFFQKTWRSR